MSNLVNVQDRGSLVVDDDWGPAFKAAIAKTVATLRNGMFVPADAADYTVRKPARSHRQSTGVSPVSPFLARATEAAFGCWEAVWGTSNMIAIGGDCVDVTVRNLYLNGDSRNLTDLDPGQHTHTIQIVDADADALPSSTPRTVRLPVDGLVGALERPWPGNGSGT